MNYLWIVYWIIIFISIIFSIVIMFKKNKVLGISQFALSVLVPFLALLFALKRNMKQSELEYFYEEVMAGNVSAYLVVILYLVLIGLFIYNILSLRKKNDKIEEDKSKDKKEKK